MDSSDSERELKKGKLKKHKDNDSGDERKEKRDREKEERKERKDREKEERKSKTDKEKEERKEKKDKEKEERKGGKDKEKEERDREKEERKAKMDKEKEERKEKKDKDKEESKEHRGKVKDERDEKKKHKEEHKHHEDDKKDKPPHPSGSGVHGSSGPVDLHDGKAAKLYNPIGAPSQPPQSGEVPWFLREPGSDPSRHHPSRVEPDLSVQSPPPQYSSHPPSNQQPFQAVGNTGGVPPIQGAPPSGYRIPLSPNEQFPASDRLGRPPATDFDGSTPVFIGSAIFPDSVHPCRIVPSPQPLCRVLHNGSEVEHHGRYDLLPVTQDMEWVPAKHGELPPGRRPIEGGYESNGKKLYHALGFIKGLYVPGKAGGHLQGAIIPFEGSEYHLAENYSVLCWK